MRTFLTLMEYGRSWVVNTLLLGIRKLLPTALVDALLRHCESCMAKACVACLGAEQE